MAFNHGVSTKQVSTSISTPKTAASGIAFAVGAAPVHLAGGKINEPIICYNYNEAVKALGYSDDWEKYPLCEVMYSQFKLYNVSPVIFVNVLDPQKHKVEVTEETCPIIDKKILLPLEVLKDTVETATYKEGTDFELFYEGENLVLEVIEGGGILESVKELPISFSKIDHLAIKEADIIGGFDTITKTSSGLELIDMVFPKYGIAPDLILAPGWSCNATVAAVMGAKAEKINGVFEAKALIDVDTKSVKHYSDVPEWKKKNNINSKSQILCFPKVKNGKKVFNLSVQTAGRIGKTDTENGGCPSESPSNKSLQIDSMVLSDNTEVLLDIQQANFLNSNGVVTALNFTGGYVLWGNETACFPADTDVKNYFVCVSRMFGWVANSIILTYWSKTDKNITRRLIDSIVDSLNIWFNGLTAEEKLLGGRVEFKEEENSAAALMAGKAVFHIYMTPPSPAKELEFVIEYDMGYVSAALTA